MNRRSVKHTLTMTCLMLVLLASLLLGATSIFSIRNTTNMALTEYESAMDSGYNTEIKSEVQTVIAVLQAEYDKSQAGELTEEEAKAEAKEIVRAMRYRDDGSGYFWIDDTDYNLVMHPILAEQEGNNRYDLEDQNGVMIIQEIMKVCNSADGGGSMILLYEGGRCDGCAEGSIFRVVCTVGDGQSPPVTTSMTCRQR